MSTSRSGPDDRHLDVRDSTRLIERAWSSLSDAMVLATPGHGDEHPTIVVANSAFRSLFGVDTGDLRGWELLPFLTGDGSALLERIDGMIARDGPSILDFLVIHDAADGAKLVEWELATVRDGQGAVDNLIGILRDVTSSAVRPSLGTVSDIDPLTGLPNYLHFMSRLDRSVEHAAQARSYTFAVITLETGGLRAVEERLGAALAGTVLEALAHRVRQCLRPGDLIARVGREQMAVLLDRFGPSGPVESVLERIVAVTRQPYSIGGEHISLRTVGAAGPVYTPDDAPGGAREVMDALERAVDRAKT